MGSARRGGPGRFVRRCGGAARWAAAVGRAGHTDGRRPTPGRAARLGSGARRARLRPGPVTALLVVRAHRRRRGTAGHRAHPPPPHRTAAAEVRRPGEVWLQIDPDGLRFLAARPGPGWSSPAGRRSSPRSPPGLTQPRPGRPTATRPPGCPGRRCAAGSTSATVDVCFPGAGPRPTAPTPTTASNTPAAAPPPTPASRRPAATTTGCATRAAGPSNTPPPDS